MWQNEIQNPRQTCDIMLLYYFLSSVEYKRKYVWKIYFWSSFFQWKSKGSSKICSWVSQKKEMLEITRVWVLSSCSLHCLCEIMWQDGSSGHCSKVGMSRSIKNLSNGWGISPSAHLNSNRNAEHSHREQCNIYLFNFSK